MARSKTRRVGSRSTRRFDGFTNRELTERNCTGDFCDILDSGVCEASCRSSIARSQNSGTGDSCVVRLVICYAQLTMQPLLKRAWTQPARSVALPDAIKVAQTASAPPLPPELEAALIEILAAALVADLQRFQSPMVGTPSGLDHGEAS
jgi:hypothetical protein